MKIKEGFMLRTLAGSHVVVPVGAATTKVNGIITLNGSGAILWNLLCEGANLDQLADALVSKYGISAEAAAQDAGDFVDMLRKIGCLEE